MDACPGDRCSAQSSSSPVDCEGIYQYLRPFLNAPQTRHFADRIAFTSANLWLAEDSNMRVDKLSMAMSIETRAPFEDYRLVELALRIPLEHKLRGGDFKTVLKSAMTGIVPDEVLTRPKRPFFPPASECCGRFCARWWIAISRPNMWRSGSDAPGSRRYSGGESHGAAEIRDALGLGTAVFHLWHAIYIDQSLTLDHKIRPADLLPEIAAHDHVMV